MTPRHPLSSLLPAVAAASLLLAGPAQAGNSNGFGVSTAASASDPYPFVFTTSAYRTIGDSSGNYTLPGDVAPVSFDSCAPAVTSDFTCTSTRNGPTTPSFDLTASRNSVQFVTSLVAASPILLSSNATASADLATGTVALGLSTGYRHGTGGMAALGDTLNFEVADAAPAATTLITVHYTLDGSLDVTDGDHASYVSTLGFGGAFATVSYNHGAYLVTSQGGWNSFEWSQVSPGQSSFTGVYALQGSTPVVGLGNRMVASAQANDGTAFSLHARLQLDLPDAVTYSSASGVLLAAPVPEPQTAALLLAGLLVLARLARRHNA